MMKVIILKSTGGIHGYWFGIKVFSCSPMQFVG